MSLVPSMAGIGLVCVFMLLCQLIRVDASLTYISGGCSGDDGNYTQGSVYQHNLNLLLSNLSSRSSIVKFYNITTGNVPNKVFGLFQCREDLSLEVCHGCVEDATRRILLVCPRYGDAIIWYDECMFRYANHSIFSLYEWSPSYSQHSLINASNYDEFTTILTKTMGDLIRDVALTRHFATREANLSLIDTLYFLAACTPDLDRFECQSCLETAVAELRACCDARISARILLPSCNLRYDIIPFYNYTKQRTLPLVSSRTPTNQGKRLKPSVIAGISVALVIGLGVVSIWLCVLRKNGGGERSRKVVSPTPKVLHTDEAVTTEVEGLGDAFVQYDFATLKAATSDFSVDNQLGEGGFGVVYKGILNCGQEIAIKRLSAKSRQGATEFMNEARFVAKLQHKNLVKLVGFCSEGEEKLLAYEFMPNTSLDHILFDPKRQQILEWETRYKIIIGIARGLQYLHEDSRLRIIHRDLKTANILLDGDMNPKIADFGTAKLFGDKQKFGNTSRIVGTYGYMAPEYVLSGEFSEKSDVYSFGVMILEIVSGQRNRTISQSPQKEYLLTYAWRLWKEDHSFELIDSRLSNRCSKNEVIRCIQIGLLCVQRNAALRPTMGAVVIMLTGSVTLPLPSAPVLACNDTYCAGNSLELNELHDSSTVSTNYQVS